MCDVPVVEDYFTHHGPTAPKVHGNKCIEKCYDMKQTQAWYGKWGMLRGVIWYGVVWYGLV